MADKTPVNTVVDENDIPGSVLDMNKLSSYRVDELKFWLSCRGDSLKNLSTKAACIQRRLLEKKHPRMDQLEKPKAHAEIDC